MIHLTYTKIKGYSGQNNVSVQLLKLFKSENIQIREIHLFPLRGKNMYRMISILGFYYPMLMLKSARFLISNKHLFLANLQQTTYSMLGFSLVHWPLFFSLGKSKRLILALNGSIFYKWPKNSFNHRLFRYWTQKAHRIVTVGPIMEFGLKRDFAIASENLYRINNFTTFAINKAFILKKHESDTIHITYLSLFVEKKGYKAFVESMILLCSENRTQQIQINLCGIFIKTEECSDLHSVENFKILVDRLKQAVVDRPNITLRVIDQGIFGAQKQKVLEQTHIFILPTQYANEAQPIAVIEAAANGAALIVGNTGEIPEMFSPKALELLATSDAQDIFDKMLPLIENKQYRIQMGLAAYEEALERYSADIFNERWLKLIHENMPNSIHA